MNESDLLVVIGASFSHHTGIAPYKPIVQIDDDHATIGRFDAVTADVLGDAALTLTALTDSLGEVKAEDQRSDVAERWAIWRAEMPAGPPTTAAGASATPSRRRPTRVGSAKPDRVRPIWTPARVGRTTTSPTGTPPS